MYPKGTRRRRERRPVKERGRHNPVKRKTKENGARQEKYATHSSKPRGHVEIEVVELIEPGNRP